MNAATCINPEFQKFPTDLALRRLKLYQLAQLRERRIKAANRAIGLLNKKSLRNWPRRAEFVSRTWSIKNKLVFS